MARPRKEGQYVTYKLDVETIDLIDRYSERTMIPKTRIVEAAVKEYLKPKIQPEDSETY